MVVYLDNAATSHPKPEPVYRAVSAALRGPVGNPGRGQHGPALTADRLLFDCREQLAAFFGIGDASRLVFTPGATWSLNLALAGLLRPGDRVVTTRIEHNAVTRPLGRLARQGVEVVKVPADPCGRTSAQALRHACDRPTALVVMSHASNVCGALQPVAEMGAFCRQRGIPLLVDAAQTAGHRPIDVEALGIDLLAVPGHKGMLGPQGVGLLYVAPRLRLTPLVVGGTGSASSAESMPEVLPEGLEPGTPNLPGIAGLAAGARWLRRRGAMAVAAHYRECLDGLLDGLRRLPGTRVVGPPAAEENAGVVSFVREGIDPAEMGYRLDRDFGIQVRVGLHCAPEAHRSLGTFPTGTVRVSPGIFTSPGDIDGFLRVLRDEF